MMKTFLGRLALVLAIGLAPYVALAQSTAQPASVGYNSTSGCPGTQTSCFLQYGSAVPVTGTITASLGAFTPNGTGQTISVTTASSSTAVTGGPSYVVVNNGANPIYVTFSTGSGTATTAGTYIPAGWGLNLNGGTANHINAISTGGVSTLTVSPGTGLATITSGAGSGAATVSINQATPGSTNGVSEVDSGGGDATDPVNHAVQVNCVVGCNVPAITNYALETGGNLAAAKTDLDALSAAIGTAIPAGTNVIGVVGVAQGSTTSGQSGSLIQCAVTTSAPTYTTGQTSPASCDTAGGLRITAPAASPVNVTVTTPPNDVLTGPTNVTGAADVAVNSQGSGAAALQVTGTFTGLSGLIRGSVDGTNYINIGAYNANTGAVIAPATTITATGLYVIPAAGYRSIQYHVTAVATGTAVVNLNSSAGALDPPASVTNTGRNVNLTGINGVAPVVGNGITGTGSQRVTIASDNTAFSVNATLQTQTDTTMAGGVNVKEINAVTPLMGNGTTGTGSQRVTIASDNTAFSVNSQPTPVTSGGLSTFSEIVPANTTSVAVKASAGQIYDIEMGSNSGTPLSSPLYVKFYDAAQGSTTCGSGTPKSRYVFTGGSNVSIALGEAFATAITACVTAGIADNDTTSPAATTFLLTVHYK